MKIFVLLFIGIIKFSDQKPTSSPTLETTTIENTVQQNETSTEILIFVTEKEPEEKPKTVSLTENDAQKNSSDGPPTDVQLPVDLLSEDILLDPSVILARAERSLESLENVEMPEELKSALYANQFSEDTIPTYYFVKFVRIPRSIDRKLVPEKINYHFRMPEEPYKTIRRFSRSTTKSDDRDDPEDLDGADDGFIIRPFFKYRHEQSKKANKRGYRNRDSYSYYPRYPIFPGK